MIKRGLPIVAVILALAGCAQKEDPKSAHADRTVVVTMRDNHFEPDEVEVKTGETIAFRFLNRGSTRHDAFFGDADEQAQHEKEMRSGDDEGHDGHTSTEADAVVVEPGKSATLVQRFDQGAQILIGCHEPGHYADGMIAEINIR